MNPRNPLHTFRFILLLIIAFHGMKLSSQAIYRTAKKLPDTGQNLSYTNTFGEDNDYSINPPKLALYGKGMVYDSVTTFVWQQGDGGEMTWQQAKSTAIHLPWVVSTTGYYPTPTKPSPSSTTKIPTRRLISNCSVKRGQNIGTPPPCRPMTPARFG